MKIILYAKDGNKSGATLQRVLNLIIPKNKIDACRNIDELIAMLRIALVEDSLFILHASSKHDLMDFYTIRELFMDRKLIIILPDHDDESVTKAHALRPRFLSYHDSDLIEVAAVINRIVSNSGPIVPIESVVALSRNIDVT